MNRQEDWLVLDFPIQPAIACEIPDAITKGLGVEVLECLCSEDYIVVLKDEKAVHDIQPDFEALKDIDLRGVIVTSVSHQYDFVTRFFAPKYGLDEDPVTGSAYTQLAPYWSKKLQKKKLYAKQVSARGGELYCEVAGARVFIFGQAVKFLKGEITL